MANILGGEVLPAQNNTAREYGKTITYYDTKCKLFQNIPDKAISWMSHSDYMAKIPDGFELAAHSDACPNVAIADEMQKFYGVQFHPEVNHTEHGNDIIHNFLYEVCNVSGTWRMEDFCKNTIKELREKIGSDARVLLALSGGVDSSVLAALLAEAIGERVSELYIISTEYCITVIYKNSD